MTHEEANVIADMVAAKVSITTKAVLTLEEAAQYMGVSKSQLYKLTHTKNIPHSKPAGKMCYFNRADLETWLMGNPVATTEELADRANDYCMTHK